MLCKYGIDMDQGKLGVFSKWTVHIFIYRNSNHHQLPRTPRIIQIKCKKLYQCSIPQNVSIWVGGLCWWWCGGRVKWSWKLFKVLLPRECWNFPPFNGLLRYGSTILTAIMQQSWRSGWAAAFYPIQVGGIVAAAEGIRSGWSGNLSFNHR